MAEQKLFPIFYPNTKSPRINLPKTPNKSKRRRGLDKNQMLIDAGQKRLGATHCSECDIVYNKGDPGEELMHLNYHNSVNTLRFSGWKSEHVVSLLEKDRIIRVMPGDPKAWWKKVESLLDVVNRDLGFYEMELNVSNCQVFLYISNKTIAGCIVAEPKSSAHRMLVTNGVDFCSEEAYPIKCGVSRIWVARNFRNKGIGTTLMNTLKNNFIYGSVLCNNEVALSSPTDLGKQFATKYFKTSNFLIYMS